MLRVRAVMESTCTLLLGSSCTYMMSLLLCLYMSKVGCVLLGHDIWYARFTMLMVGHWDAPAASLLQDVVFMALKRSNSAHVKGAGLQ